MEKSDDNKKSVLLSFDEQLILDTKRELFKKGVTLQQFVTFVCHKLTLHEEKATGLLSEAAVFNRESLSAKDKNDILKIDSNTLYALFEHEEVNK